MAGSSRQRCTGHRPRPNPGEFDTGQVTVRQQSITEPEEPARFGTSTSPMERDFWELHRKLGEAYEADTRRAASTGECRVVLTQTWVIFQNPLMVIY